MKVSSRIDGSICGAILLHRPSSWTWTATTTITGTRTCPRPLLGPLNPSRSFSRLRLRSRTRTQTAASLSNSNTNITAVAHVNLGRVPHQYPVYTQHYSICGCQGARCPPPLQAQSSVGSRAYHSSPRPSTSTKRPTGSSRRFGTIFDINFFFPSATFQCGNHTAAENAVASNSDPPLDPDSVEKPTAPETPELTKEELLELVELVDPEDGYEKHNVEEHFKFFRDPYLRGYVEPEGPIISLARNKDDYELPTQDQVRIPTDEESAILWDLRRAVLRRLRNPLKMDLDTIYDCYLRVPEPRMSYIDARLRHQIFQAFGWPEKKDSKSMLRYFAVVADVQSLGIPLTRAEWNGALSFAGRYVGWTTETETEAAIKLWREMEQEVNVKGSDVTFNILFDVASKAGNFELAEMVYREMENRGHRPNRYHHVSLIHFFGLKLETAGMRAAFREMVQAGEMIDTVVLNAIIRGFLRSGQDLMAERVYERMWASAQEERALEEPEAGEGDGKIRKPKKANSANMIARNRVFDKFITQMLMSFAKLGRRHPELRPVLQRATPIAPDLQTYRIMLNYYGIEMGDMNRVERLIVDMSQFGIPLHGAIFFSLFKSFALHGSRHPNVSWNRDRLDSIWRAFLRAYDENGGPTPDLEIRKWMAVWVLKAWMKCATRDEAMAAYEALRERWELDVVEEQFMIDFVAMAVWNGK